MIRSALPLGLAVASAWLLPLGASAVPIKAADGVADSVPSSANGPRRPGPIPNPPAEEGLGSGASMSNGRGRPVPGKSGSQSLDRMAEIDPAQIRP